jgi:hypothetical protein
MYSSNNECGVPRCITEHVHAGAYIELFFATRLYTRRWINHAFFMLLALLGPVSRVVIKVVHEATRLSPPRTNPNFKQRSPETVLEFCLYFFGQQLTLTPCLGLIPRFEELKISWMKLANRVVTEVLAMH